MLAKKLSLLFLCLVFTNQISAQTVLKTEIKAGAAAELQEKAIALLNNLGREAEQFSLPLNRMTARIEIAGLLWKSDEKQARIVFQTAVSELNAMINQIPPVNLENEEENIERYVALGEIGNLRVDLLSALASRDPKFALESLQTLSRKDGFGKNLFEDDQSLEVRLAALIAERDPKQAYELARKNLENDIDANLFSTLESLYKKDAELGAKLAQEVAGKIKSRDTTVVSPSDSVNAIAADGAIKINQTIAYTVNTMEILSFLDSIKKLNRQAEKGKAKAVLSDNEIREIIDILAQKFVRQQPLWAYEVVKAMPEIIKYFPAQATAIERKINQQESAFLSSQLAEQNFQNETEGKSADEIAQFVERKPVVERDNLYYKAAEIALAKEEFEEAKKFHDKIKIANRPYLDKAIENALPLVLAGKGELREVRRMLAKLKTPEERIEILTALAASIAGKGDKKSASAIAAEARAMYSGRMKNRKNLTSVLQIAQAYAVFDAEQSFAFLENNVSFFNDVIAAGILLAEFNDYDSVQNEEVRLDSVRRQSYGNLPKGVALLKNLSAADFERTIALADRFSRSEVRFYARFRVAEALLNPDAEKDEKAFQSNIENDQEEH